MVKNDSTGKPHPLDPLSAAEVSAASVACKLYAKEEGLESPRFSVVTLKVWFIQTVGLEIHQNDYYCSLYYQYYC